VHSNNEEFARISDILHGHKHVVRMAILRSGYWNWKNREMFALIWIWCDHSTWL